MKTIWLQRIRRVYVNFRGGKSGYRWCQAWGILLAVILGGFSWSGTFAEEVVPVEGVPTIHLPDRIQAGAELEFTVETNVENAYYVYYRLYSLQAGNENQIGSGSINAYNAAQASFTYRDGYRIQAGEYKLVSYVYTHNPYGYTDETAVTFNVTEEGQPARLQVEPKGTESVIGQRNEFELTGYDASSGSLPYRCEYTWDDQGWNNPSAQTGSLYGSSYTTGVTVSSWGTEAEVRTYLFRFSYKVNQIWSPWTEPIAVRVSQYGAVGDITGTVPENVLSGQDLSVTVSADHAESWYGTLYQMNGSSQSRLTSVSAQEGNTLVFSAANMTAGSYKIHVEASATGYKTSSADFLFDVTDAERAPGPTVQPAANAVYQSYPPFLVEKEQADRYHFELYQSDGVTRSNSTYMDVNDEKRYAPFYLVSLGSYVMKVSAHVGNAWTEYTVFPFEVVEKPRIESPVIHLSAAEIAGGTDLTISLDPVEGAGRYLVRLEKQNGEAWDYIAGAWLYSDHPNLETTIEGYRIEKAGVYRVTAYAEADDTDNYRQSETSVVSVSVTSDIASMPVFSVDQLTVKQENKWHFTLPGFRAEKIRTHIQGEDVNTYNTLSNIDGAFEVTAYGRPGSRTFTYCAYDQGVWTAFSEPIELYVIEKPKLDVPSVTLSSDALQAGENLTVTLGEVSGAKSYYLSVYRKEDSGQKYMYGVWLETDRDALTCTIPGYSLIEAAEYELSVQVSPADYENYAQSMAQCEFSVTGTAPAAGNVTFPETTVYEENEVRIVLPETIVSEAYILASRDGQQVNSWHWMREQNDACSIRFWSTGVFEVRVRVFENSRWSQWSEPVTIEVLEKTTLETPVVTLSGETIEAGSDLVILFEAVDGAGSYGYNLCRQSNGQWESFYGTSSDRLAQTIKGYVIAEPGEYRIDAYAYPDESHRLDHKISEMVSLYFTVSGDVRETPSFTIEKAQAHENETVSILAEGFHVTQTHLDVTNAQGSRWTYEEDGAALRFWYAGEITVRVSFCIQGKWTRLSEPFTYTILPKEKAPAPNFEIPETIEAGTDLMITFHQEDISQIQTVNLMLYRMEDGRAVRVAEEQLEYQEMITFPGYSLTEGEYELEVFFYPENWEIYAESDRVRKPFTAVGSQDEGPTISLSSETIYIGDMLVVTAVADGAEGFAIRWDDEQWWDRSEGAKGSYTTTRSMGTAGDCEIHATCRRNGKWSRETVVSVHTTSLGHLDAPRVTAEPITAGENAVIHVEPVEHAEYYRIIIEKDQGAWIGERRMLSSGDLVLDASLFDAGHYTVRVSAHAFGYEPSADTFVPLQVQESENPIGIPIVTCLTPEVTSGEILRFEMNLPEGASRVRWKTQWDDYSGSDMYSVNSSPALISFVYWAEGPSNVRFQFSAYVSGRWSPWSSAVAVTMKAPEGGEGEMPQLEAPVFTLSSETIPMGSGDITVTPKSIGAAEYAWIYLYEVNEETGRQTHISNYRVDAEELKPVSLQTEAMIPGKYLVHMGSYARGYRYASSEQTFTVTGSSAHGPAPSVTVSPELSLSTEPLTISVSAAGTIRALRIRTPWNSLYMASSAAGDFAAGHTISYVSNSLNTEEGTMMIQVSALVDGVWSEYSDYVTFRRVPDLTPIPAIQPVLSASSIFCGESVTVSWEPVSGASSYTVYRSMGTQTYSQNVTDTRLTLKFSDHATPGVWQIGVTANQPYMSSPCLYIPLKVRTAPAQSGALKLPSSLNVVGEEAFVGAQAGKVIVPEGCKEIESRAFAFCENLSVIVIPSSVTSIAADAFIGCSDFVIQTDAGSYAAQFAADHGIEVTLR